MTDVLLYCPFSKSQGDLKRVDPYIHFIMIIICNHSNNNNNNNIAQRVSSGGLRSYSILRGKGDHGPSPPPPWLGLFLGTGPASYYFSLCPSYTIIDFCNNTTTTLISLCQKTTLVGLSSPWATYQPRHETALSFLF